MKLKFLHSKALKLIKTAALPRGVLENILANKILKFLRISYVAESNLIKMETPNLELLIRFEILQGIVPRNFLKYQGNFLFLLSLSTLFLEKFGQVNLVPLFGLFLSMQT